jgi:toxin ParE1/3/4
MDIAQDSLDAADRFISSLEEVFERLQEMPQLGRDRSELGMDVRSYVHKNYVIFYQQVSEGVRILRVISGFRDISDLRL